MPEPSAPALYTITGPRRPGHLTTMTRPPRLEHPGGDTAALRNAGADVVVCALPDAQRTEPGLADKPRLAEAGAQRFVALPILDLTTPSIPTMLPALQDPTEELRTGAHVLAHYRYAIRRSSPTAVHLTTLETMTPKTASTPMEQARGTKAPDTEEQHTRTPESSRLDSPDRQHPSQTTRPGR